MISRNILEAFVFSHPGGVDLIITFVIKYVLKTQKLYAAKPVKTAKFLVL